MSDVETDQTNDLYGMVGQQLEIFLLTCMPLNMLLFNYPHAAFENYSTLSYRTKRYVKKFRP